MQRTIKIWGEQVDKMNSKRAFNHFFAGIGLTYGFFEYAREEMADQIDEYQ